MHGLRAEYQDRINFVILDYDVREHLDLAREMAIANHPAYGIVPPNSAPGDVANRFFGPRNEPALREILDEAIARYES